MEPSIKQPMVKGDSDLPENVRTYMNKERTKIFIMTVIATAIFTWFIISMQPKHIDEQIPYTESYIMSCDHYQICNYTRQLFCPSIAGCAPEYGCWTELRNCTDKR